MRKRINFSKLPESDVILNYIKERYRKGLGTSILVTGLSGTGKSSVCQRLGELASALIHDESKFVARDIVYSLLQFLERIKEVKETGEVIITEEVSVLFPSRRALSIENVAVSRVLDTIRKKQIVLFANAPLFTSIDSHIRAMGHILIETQSINKTQGVVLFKAWKLQTNPHTGKTYRHRFTRDGRDITSFFTRKPSSSIWEEYEHNKDEFMDTLYEQLKRKQEKKEGIKPKMNEMRPLTQRELQVHQMVNVKGLTMTETAKQLGVHLTRVSQVCKKIKKKLEIFGKNKANNKENKPLYIYKDAGGGNK